jgi:hypothetical protein
MSGESESTSTPNPHRERILDLRHRLATLHKTLIESERETYEQTFGRLQSANQFLQLLIRDPWFAWLHPLSELVVFLDEVLEEEDPPTAERVTGLINRTRALLTASENGDGFPRSYFEALQREPDVVMAHAEVAKFLKGR